MKGSRATTTTVKMSAAAKDFFAEHFLNPGAAIGASLRNFIYIYYETISEVQALFRSNQYDILVRALRAEFYRKPYPEPFDTDNLAKEMPEGIQKIISEMPMFSKAMLEMHVCREKGPINAPAAKGERVQINVSPATKAFYADFFRSATSGYSWGIERFPLFYNYTIKHIPDEVKEKAVQGLLSLYVSERPHPSALGCHLIMSKTEGMSNLSVFQRACLEIYAGLYNKKAGVMQIYTPVSRKNANLLAGYFDMKVPKLVDYLLGMVPPLADQSVQEAKEAIGVPGILALIEKRVEHYGPKSIFGANGFAIRRLCRQITPNGEIDPDDLSKRLERVSTLTLQCLETLSPSFWKKQLSSK